MIYNNQVTYKGEELPVVYTSAAGSRYAVCERKRALHGKWLVFSDGDDLIVCCEYLRGARRVCDELNALSTSVH